ncbi:predicted gene 6351 isoform 2 [Mus musculus]|nr:predicted gene 7982 isoform 2 [Mus musculus]NP_001393190.1 predicted gene 6351 isoform 2 [Mus musculus]
MNVHTPPTLQKLAIQTLVREEALGMSDLEEMAHGLFPALFKEAIDGRYIKLIKALVIAWPFHCLPVGALMRTTDLETLQAVLDGVDIRRTIGFHPRRKKLQYLDLRNVHHSFWNIWTDSEDSDYSAEILDEKKALQVLDDTLEDLLHYLLPDFTERFGFLCLLSEPLSAKTSGIERCGLTGFGSYASERSPHESGRHS